MAVRCVVHKFNKTGQNGTNEILHAEFCNNILHVQRRAPNSSCRAELGQCPLLLNIQKQALNFWNRIKTSDPLSLSHKALCYQESNPQRSPLCLLAQTINHSDHYTMTTSASGQKHSEHKTQPNYDERKRKIHKSLDRTNRIPEQDGHICSPKQTVQRGSPERRGCVLTATREQSRQSCTS